MAKSQILKYNKEEVFNEHADYLFNLAMSKIKNREMAKDFVHDSFLAAFNHWDEFQGKSSIRTWLSSILIRKIIDYWRKAETRYTDTLSNYFDVSGHWRNDAGMNSLNQNPFVQLEKSESQQILEKCIERLPLLWKSIMLSKYFEEKKAEEICKEFSITTSNLWIIIHRSKLQLRKCIEKNYNHDEV